MNRHLDESEIAAAIAGLDLEPELAAHLDVCLTCRREVYGTMELVAARREAIAAGGPDWQAQREAILANLGASRGRRRRWSRSLLAAAAAAVLALGLSALLPGRAPERRAELPVENILAEVNETLASDTVPGLEPIEILVPSPDEMAQAFEGGSS